MSRSSTSRKTLRDFFHVVFKRKLQILLFFLITVCVITVVTFTTEPIYEATSKIETLNAPSNMGDIGQNPHIQENQKKQITSNIEILTGLDLVKQVAGDLGPTVIYKDLIEKPKETMGGSQPMLPDQQTLLEKAVEQLQHNLKAEEGKKSSVIEVRFRHPDRFMATTVVNTLVTLYSDRYLREGEGRNIAGGLTAEKTGKRARIQPALPPAKLIKPKVMVNLLLAVFAGFLGAFVLAFVREYLDDSLEKTQDIEDTLELPILAYIPEQDRITDEIMGRIDQAKIRESKEKRGFPTIRFSPNPPWILAACIVLIAGVIILYKGLNTKREEPSESPAKIAQSVFSAKIDKNGENTKESAGGNQENPGRSIGSSEAEERKSEPPLAPKAKQRGPVEDGGNEKQEDNVSTAVFHQESIEKTTETSSQEKPIETTLEENRAKLQTEETDQIAKLEEETDKKFESTIPEREIKDGSKVIPKGPEEKKVEEKTTEPIGTENKKDAPLTQKPEDFFVQVGAFGKVNRAEMTVKKLRENGFVPYVLESDTKKNTKLYRVRVKFNAQEMTAGQAVGRLRELGYKDCFKVK